MADTGADNNVPQTEKSEIIADEAPAQGSAPAEEVRIFNMILNSVSNWFLHVFERLHELL